MRIALLKGNANPIIVAGRELWKYRWVISQLSLRELKVRYKRSVLGWLWSLINPAALLLVYTLVFGVFLAIEPPTAGNGRLRSFAIWLFAGLIVWEFFQSVVTGSIGWLIESGTLRNKIYFPAEIPVFAGALATLVQTCTEVAILLIVLGVAQNISFTALFVPVLILLLLVFTLGLGLVISLSNVYFRDVSHIVQIGITVLFYATPIIYPPEIVPVRLGWLPIRDILLLNPLAQFVLAMRDVLYGLAMPHWNQIVGLVVTSLITFGLGLLSFSRFGANLSEDL